MKYTKAGDAQRVRAKHEAASHSRQDIGRGLKLYNLEWRYPNAVWRALARARKESLRRKLAARGLSKQSWQRLAVAAGLEIKVPGYVARAVPTTGRTYPENAVAKRVGRGGRFSIRFMNLQPTVQIAQVGGRAAWQRALNGPAKSFATSLRKGVFRDLAQVSRRYPGLRVN